jgi:hypothetical protein
MFVSELKIMRKILFILLSFLTTLGFSQNNSVEKKPKLIQFSGVIVSADSLYPVPFASVMIKGTHHGTVSDYYGFFSFVAQENDIIEFSALGYKANKFRIPDSLPETKFSIIHVMNTDTVYLQGYEVFPWPSKEQFKHAFMNLQLPNDDNAKAQRNLQALRNPEWYTNVPADAAANQNYMFQQNNTRVYGNAQIPGGNLLNPYAWSKFIEAWRSGKLKRQ